MDLGRYDGTILEATIDVLSKSRGVELTGAQLQEIYDGHVLPLGLVSRVKGPGGEYRNRGTHLEDGDGQRASIDEQARYWLSTTYNPGR